MKRNFMIAAAAILAFAATVHADAPKVGDKAPDFKLTGSDGKD
jgi:hypothetical protein